MRSGNKELLIKDIFNVNCWLAYQLLFNYVINQFIVSTPTKTMDMVYGGVM